MSATVAERADTGREHGGFPGARVRGEDRWRTCAVAGVAALLLYLVIVPLFFLIYGSLFTGLPGQPGVLSFRKYLEVLSSVRSYRIIGVSFAYAFGSTLVGLVIGTTAVWLVQRTDIPARRLFTFLALFPLLTPPVLTTVAWVLLLDRNMGLLNGVLRTVGIPGVLDGGTLLGMIWVRGIMDVPLVFLWLWPALVAMDPGLEEAAAMCRAAPTTVIRTISLPLVLPSLASVFLIAFVLAIEDLTVPVVIGLPAHVNVLATEIFLAYSRVPTDVHAASVYAVILLVITMALMLVYRRLTYRTERYAVVRGRGYRPLRAPLGRARLPLAGLLACVLLVIVGLPVFVLVWTSLSRYLQVPSMAGLRHLSLAWYGTVLRDPMALRGFSNTALLGVGTALVIMPLAMIVGWIVIRSRATFRAWLDFLAFMPIAIPGLVVGLSLMWLYLTLPVPVYGTLWIVGIAFVTRFLPYGVRLAYAGFSQLHAELEEAAYVSGSSWAKALRTISLPLLAPTLTVGGIYTVLLAFRELAASLLLVSFGNEPYSVVAYQIWDAGETGKTAAYGVVAIVVMTVLVLGVQRATGREPSAG